MVRFKRWLGTAGAVLMVSSAAVGCGDSGNASSDTFKVGYLGPLAGQLAYLTEGDLEGLRTYIDQVNAEGGVNGRTIEIVALDDQGRPDTAATQYRQLTRDGVSVVAGMPISTTAEALLRDIDRDEVPIIGYGLVTDTLIDSDFSFTTGWTPDHYAEAVAVFIEEHDFGTDTPTIGFVGSETPASKEAAQVLTDRGEASGAWSIIGEAFLPATLTDVNPSLAPIARQDPDLIVQWTPSLPIIAEAYKAQGLLDIPVLAPYYTDEVQGAALDLPNYYYPQMFVSPASGDAGIQGVLDAAEAAGYPGGPEKPYFGFGYAVGVLIVAALEECEGDCDGAEFAEALASVETSLEGFSAHPFGFAGGSEIAFGHARWMHFTADGEAQTEAVTDWFQVEG